MYQYDGWERGMCLGVLIGSFLGPFVSMFVIISVLSYDVWGPRSKYLLTRAIDNHFKLPVGFSSAVVDSISYKSEGTGGTGGADSLDEIEDASGPSGPSVPVPISGSSVPRRRQPASSRRRPSGQNRIIGVISNLIPTQNDQ